MSEHDYALVEDTNNKAKGLNPIVACVSLLNVPAYYGSVNLDFGEPELIATEPVSLLLSFFFVPLRHLPAFCFFWVFIDNVKNCAVHREHKLS